MQKWQTAKTKTFLPTESRHNSKVLGKQFLLDYRPGRCLLGDESHRHEMRGAKTESTMRVVILGSGRGSNAEAILEAEKTGSLGRAQVVQIFSDRQDAGILALGPRYGVPATFIDPAPFKTKLEGDGEARYVTAINERKADLVVLAGFMRVLKPGFLTAFQGRIINLHPSLLPSFPGLDAIGQAWRRGVKITGCTVHYVTTEVDGGPIIDQTAFRITSDDTLETLTEKMHSAEHQLLPDVIAKLGVAQREDEPRQRSGTNREVASDEPTSKVRADGPAL